MQTVRSVVTDASVEETLALYALVDWIVEQATRTDRYVDREWIVDQLQSLLSRFHLESADWTVPAIGETYRPILVDTERQLVVVGVDQDGAVPGTVAPAVCLKDESDGLKYWTSVFVLRWAYEKVA